MVKIKLGMNGYFLKVDGFCIKRDYNSYSNIKVTKLEGKVNNWYATEFQSIKELREFWNHYKILIQFEIANKKRLTDEV